VLVGLRNTDHCLLVRLVNVRYGLFQVWGNRLARDLSGYFPDQLGEFGDQLVINRLDFAGFDLLGGCHTITSFTVACFELSACTQGTKSSSVRGGTSAGGS